MNEFNPERIHVDADLLKEYIDTDILLRAYDALLQPKYKGRIIDIICPFHDDRNHGSCKVWADKGDFYCYGCGKGGKIEILAFQCAKKLHGETLSYDRILYHLADDLGIDFGLVTKDSNGAFMKRVHVPDDSLYEELFGKSFLSINSKYKNIKMKGQDVLAPIEQRKIYFHVLFKKDREYHDEIVLKKAKICFEKQMKQIENLDDALAYIEQQIGILKKVVKDVGDIKQEWVNFAKKILAMKKIMMS